MATHSSLLVLFQSTNDPGVDAVAANLVDVPGDGRVRVQMVEPHHLIVWDGNWPIHVWYEDKPHIRDEAQEVAELFATGHPDQEWIAACDRRFVVTYEPEVEMKYFNTWLLVTERLARLVGGITFDPEAMEFVDEPDRTH